MLEAIDGACMSRMKKPTPARKDDLDSLRLPELQARYQAVVGEATRCPNRTFLVRRIREALAASKPSSAATARAPKRERAKKSAEPTRSARGRFRSMTIEELQAQYASAVGRPTGSTDRRYLRWKITPT